MTTASRPTGDFSVRGLHALVQELNRDPSLLEQDWCELAQQTFSMTNRQQEFLAQCPPELRDAVQSHFRNAAQHVQNGGNVELKVVREDDGRRALYLMTFPKVERKPGTHMLRAATAAVPIICCDANCGDWHWC